jgi:hypothetical protein
VLSRRSPPHAQVLGTFSTLNRSSNLTVASAAQPVGGGLSISTSFDADAALAVEWNVTPAAIVRARADAKLLPGSEFENDERAIFLFAKGLTDVDFVDLCTTVWSRHHPRSYAKEFAAEIDEVRRAFKTSPDTVEVASARRYYSYRYFRDGTDPDIQCVAEARR